jgi:hypothetical protein
MNMGSSLSKRLKMWRKPLDLRSSRSISLRRRQQASQPDAAVRWQLGQGPQQVAADWRIAGLATRRGERIGGPSIRGKHINFAGAHAAAAARAVPALRGRGVRLGGACRGDDSFPYTDEGHPLAARMFFAALTSRS